MRFFAVLAATCLFSGVALAEATASGEQPDDAAASRQAGDEHANAASSDESGNSSEVKDNSDKTKDKVSKPKKKCTSVRVTGSRMAKQICRTVEED